MIIILKIGNIIIFPTVLFYARSIKNLLLLVNSVVYLNVITCSYNILCKLVQDAAHRIRHSTYCEPVGDVIKIDYKNK